MRHRSATNSRAKRIGWMRQLLPGWAGWMNHATHRSRDSRLATTGMMIAPAIRCPAARVSLVEIAVSAAVIGAASERASSGSTVRRQARLGSFAKPAIRMTANVNQNVTTIVPTANMPTVTGVAGCEPRPAALIGTPMARGQSPRLDDDAGGEAGQVADLPDGAARQERRGRRVGRMRGSGRGGHDVPPGSSDGGFSRGYGADPRFSTPAPPRQWRRPQPEPSQTHNGVIRARPAIQLAGMSHAPSRRSVAVTGHRSHLDVGALRDG